MKRINISADVTRCLHLPLLLILKAKCVRQSQICLFFVRVQTIALTIMKLCMRLHKYPLQSEFYGFLPPLKNMHFLAKNVFFTFFALSQKLFNFFNFSQRQSKKLLNTNIKSWFFHSKLFPC